MLGSRTLLLAGTEATAATHRSGFSVAEISVRLEGSRAADVALGPSLSRFYFDAPGFDIGVQVEWVPRLCPTLGSQLFDSGSVWSLRETEGSFQFDFSSPILGDSPYKRLVIDDQFSRAALLLSEECFRNRAAPAPLEYPLDEVLIMHRLTREKAIELHGCGIVARTNGSAYLFVGHSGAGKSTTARLWTNHEDVEILSDDRIILREHTGEIFMYGTPWHGEAAYASPNSAPLSGIFILEHGLGNVITRLSRSQTVSELFARSFVPFHRHEYVESALDALQRIADCVPCYSYSFEPDHRAVEKILNFHD
jgi:hypothetical protein